MIKNKKTGQMYIGQSENIEKRFQQHCETSAIDIAIANEGVENFDFIILEETKCSNLNEREEYWISYFNTYSNVEHYNQSSGCNLTDRAVYNLWDVSCCNYNKSAHINKPFSYRYQGYRPTIGMFHDFVSCEVIADLVKKSI